jgi:hypothetical protein
MTVSAPHADLRSALSEGKAVQVDETMEEVRTPVSAVLPSDTPRHGATETAENGQLSAPLRAPQARGHGAGQVAYHRSWRRGKGREKFAAAVKRWRDRNREKKRAHDAVAYALRTGKLVKGPCEQLGSDCGGRVEAHHDDYTKPLSIRWLCKRHHKQADRERVAQGLAA